MGRKAREDRSKIVDEYERSGLTQQEFAERRGIPVSTLRSWIYRGRTAVGPTTTAPRLLPVTVVVPPGPSAPDRGHLLELAIGDRIVLRFPAGTDARYLAELVGAVA